jgi:putative transposase
MDFYKDQIFHIFNQGNNKEQIFFNDENYLYFIRKIREFILPYADVLAYCLMPNHFHILVYINQLEIETESKKVRTLNKSLGIMLMSYTNGVNKQQGRTGSLFRQNSKIEDGWIRDIATVGSKYEKFLFTPDNDYGRICFNYIHHNPVKAGLVGNETEWEYSSAMDYAGVRNGTRLCNMELAKKLLL